MIFEVRKLMNLSSELWVENQDLAQACLEHPFVQGFGNGTLKQENFADYVGNTFANLQNIGLKANKIVTISIGFQGFGNSIVIINTIAKIRALIIFGKNGKNKHT
jgi:thiaminase/transcriptional activator TenA